MIREIMATAQPSTSGTKPSFAKIAASARTENAKSISSRQTSAANNEDTQTGPVIANGASAKDPIDSKPPNSQTVAPKSVQMPTAQNPSIERVAGSLAEINLNARTPSLVVNGSITSGADKGRAVFRGDSGSDDSKADSGSELGAKPPSIDGKSITSGTTFALDEKESLRPDDSASVKAAAEDDDGMSIRGSMIAGSRMGSELAARGRGIALGDIPERRLAQVPQAGILTPQSGSSDQKPGASPSMPLDGVNASSDALNVIYRQAPDEKLLEAMQSPRDRLFLLRLEKQVIEFVQDSKDPYMDLPPTNSFCRMLIHKLADYYHMTHSYEHHIGSVRIFRTPFCRVPPSLAQMATEPDQSANNTPPPVILPKKIMRRGQDGEAGTPSAGPSKATSEAGSDGKEKQPVAKEKLTREEREEMYKLARERIFGSTEESTPETEDNGMSRTSSASAQNRSNVGKRGKTGKQRRDDSDSFDSRHQYAPYWNTQQPAWVPQNQYMPPQGAHMVPQGSQPYPNQPVQGFGQPTYPGMNPQGPANPYPQYSVPPQYPAGQQRPFAPSGSPMAAYGSPVPHAQPQWQQGYTSSPYPPTQQSPAPQVPQGPQGPQGPMGSAPMAQTPSQMGQSQMGSIPYAFGQLPAHMNPHDPKSQHPIPGSYNRNHAFNPMTQSFIPGSNNMPGPQAPQPPFTAPGSHHSSPQIGSPHLAYPGYQPPHQQQPYGGGYGMARQHSNTSVHGYHPQQHMMPAPAPQQGAMLQQMPPQQMPPQQMPPQHPQGSHMHQGQPPPRLQPPQHGYGQLPQYGNPASLPQKPAAGL